MSLTQDIPPNHTIVNCDNLENRLQDGKSDQSLITSKPRKPYRRSPVNENNSVFNKQLLAQLLKWCRIAIVLVLMIILVTLIYILISKPEQPSFNVHSEPDSTTAPQVTQTVSKAHLPVPKPLVVNITSSMHLRGITPETRTVIIYVLTSGGNPDGIIINDPRVTTLDLRGPVSLPWLSYVLKSLPSLTHLYVDVDEVCSGFEPSNTDSVKGVLKLPNLELLVATNSKACGILQWDALTYDFPQLKQIKIKRATLSVDPPRFQALTSLFNQTKSSLEGLEVTESYICNSCDLTEVDFPRLKWIKIMQRSSVNPFESNAHNDDEGEELDSYPGDGKKKSSGLQVEGNKGEDSNESYWAYDEYDK